MFIGTATSSYQIEGWNKGKSIWDVYTEKKNLKEVGNATNHYKLYKEDIKLLYDLGFKHYRFSISWTRIMPNEFGEIDESGIKFYHEIIDELLLYNITPYVTIYHWDLPNYIDEKYNGWLGDEIINLFLQYGILLFTEYGHKIKNWMTINEPYTTSDQGYGYNCNFAPGRNCSEQNKYLSARNQLLAHAKVGYYYRNYHEGNISIVLNANWIEPKDTNSIQNSLNYMDKTLGLFLHPLIYGHYPDSLRDETIEFTNEEKNLLMNSINFLAINHYTSYYINDEGILNTSPEWYRAQSSWLYDVPRGISRLINYIRENYSKNLSIIITECGYSSQNDNVLDLSRIHYLSGYLYELYNQNEVDGFFIWSFLDNFEWSSGYNETFGIIKIDFSSFSRTRKLSSEFISNILKIN